MATKVNVISYGEAKGMYMEGTALKGQLFNLYDVTSVGPDVYTSMLTNGSYMFYYCHNLTSWAAPLPNLTNGYDMFLNCINLISWIGDMPNLTEGNQMFQNCNKLTSFNGDLQSLTNGSSMFYYCSSLTSFSGDLSSLADGSNMFHSCRLDNNSLQNIVTTIKSWSSGNHRITIGVGSNLVTQEQQAAADTILRSKGWTPTWQRN